MLVNFFCYISFIGFVNVKGKGLVRLREAIKKKLPNFGHCPNMEGGVSGAAKPRAVNFKFWMGGGPVPPHRGVPKGGDKGAMGGGLAHDSRHSS